MSKLRLIYISLFSLILTVGIISCRDDFYAPDLTIGDGTGSITAQIDFSSVLHNVSNTRADGNAISQINSLCIFIYQIVPAKNGGTNGTTSTSYKLIRRIPMTKGVDYEIINNEATSPDAKKEIDDNTNYDKAEAATPQTKPFTIDDIPFGRYEIYAVANMEEQLKKYSDEELATPDDLRSIPLTWLESDITANSQMFGYFTLDSEQKSNGFVAPRIIVNKKTTNLHAWLKRAASKVTVAVDGQKLYDGIQVEIKSIQVKDIPKMCWLGQNNSAAVDLLTQGEKISLSDDNNDNIVTNKRNYPENIEAAHTNTAQALFFYENMHGEGQLKTQVWPIQGENPTQPMFPDGDSLDSEGYKDNEIAGTYVEVIGYYKNDGTDPKAKPASEGPIIYRFMLGKNTTNNYDAERNYHFKLTLVLKNNADDNDWHIVYNQTPDILTNEPYYISYLYNQTMSYPIKIVGGELVSLRADIPSGDDDWYEYENENGDKEIRRGINAKSWAPKEGEVNSKDEAAAEALGGVNVYWDGGVDEPGPWNGFLSLRKTEIAQFGVWPATYPDGTKDDRFNPNASLTYSYNKTYYDDNNRGWREYDVTPGTHTEPDGDYTITKEASGQYNIQLPLFTRARVMVSQTGYSGNNPFAAYNREALVKITAVIRDFNGTDHTVTKRFPIVQGRRVLNPKAIWRKGSSMERFHVRLKILPYQQSQKFEDLSSDGPWKVVVDDNCKSWVQIIPTPGESQLNPDGSISGIKDPYSENEDNWIDFSYKPNSTTSVPRGGIIHVYYNNYTCVHTIFVRQGYDPVSFYGSNVKWHTFNLRTGGYNNTLAEEAPVPEVEGAYFRRYNRQYPIDARSNTLAEFHKNGMNREFYIAEPGNATKTMKWEDIKQTPEATSWGTFKVKIGDKEIESRLPTPEDWDEIVGTSEGPRLSTIYGFGVLYADQTDETLEDIEDVYGAKPGDYIQKGMRGVIVCDEQSGTQIFLPIAASGYGRFKQYSKMNRYNRLPAGEGGVIQYANRYTWYPDKAYTLGVEKYTVQYHPLFYDLWMAEGTYYWFDGPRALDINFYTLDIATGLENDDGLGLVWRSPQSDWAGGPDPSGSDAVHVRLVHDIDKE